MNLSPDWETLIQKHLDGQTNEEEAAALSAQIVADEDVRSRYLRAAQLHGALADELLDFDLAAASMEPLTSTQHERAKSPTNGRKQVAASLVTGVLVGVLGAGMAWALGSPKAETRILSVAHGTFDTLPLGPIKRGLSPQFGVWSGDPLEVVEEADGNRRLRFMETGNVKGNPKGGASACNAFQFIDLTSLRQHWQMYDADTQQILELSVHFERKPSSLDETYPNLRADCRIYLFDTDPQTIANGWPNVLSDVLATGKKRINIGPGEKSGKAVASCLLEPEATLALITIDAGIGMNTTTPVKLGNFFADDVQLTLTSRPKLPIRLVKLNRN